MSDLRAPQLHPEWGLLYLLSVWLVFGVRMMSVGVEAMEKKKDPFYDWEGHGRWWESKVPLDYMAMFGDEKRHYGKPLETH